MKFLHRIMFTSVFILLTAVSFSLIGFAARRELWDALDNVLPGSRTIGIIIGAAIFLIASIFFISGLRPRESGRFLSFSNDNGAVNISTDAIAEYIGKLSAEFPSIVKMVTHVIPRMRKVDIEVSIRIKSGPQLHEICEVLQKRIRESMEKGLGINEVGRVIVSVNKISIEHKTE